MYVALASASNVWRSAIDILVVVDGDRLYEEAVDVAAVLGEEWTATEGHGVVFKRRPLDLVDEALSILHTCPQPCAPAALCTANHVQAAQQARSQLLSLTGLRCKFGDFDYHRVLSISLLAIRVHSACWISSSAPL